MAERRDPTVFDRTADLYARVRPGYPEELIEFVVDRASLRPDARLLELGCGPGLATEPFARRGYEVVALDQSARMLERAQEHLRDRENVTFVRSLFEDWPGEAGAFDLVYAGMAWHWMPADGRDARVAGWLRPAGCVAVLTYWALTPWEEGQNVYAEHWPEREPPPRDTIGERIARVRRDFEAAGVFRVTDVARVPWTSRHDAAGYVQMLRTCSPIAMLPADRQQRLFDAVRTRIAELGGVVEREHESIAIIARRA